MKPLLILLFLPFFLFGFNYAETKKVQHFISYMHKHHGFSSSYLKGIFAQVAHQQETLERYNGTRKNATDHSWHRYKSKILIPESITLGKRFMYKYSHSLKLAKKRYGIDKEIITAFIRVESKFGLFGGEYRVLDSLTTLAFNPNRKQRFFKSELIKALLLARREHINPLNLRGSFAGAMGCVQQMPSIYLKYGVDLDGNGKRDPNSMSDCIGSIAKFLNRNHWRNNRPIVSKARVESNKFLNLRSGYRSYYTLNTLANYGIYAPSWWRERGAYFIRLRDGNSYDTYLGDANYRIITRYNASKQYALSIALYANALKGTSNKRVTKELLFRSSTQSL
ncbi:MAG TPA: lytic murein transglycosylase [Nitratifractor sp.]|nr:lytic murein transglycosylase [Nitratifractor sp.]